MSFVGQSATFEFFRLFEELRYQLIIQYHLKSLVLIDLMGLIPNFSKMV